MTAPQSTAMPEIEGPGVLRLWRPAEGGRLYAMTRDREVLAWTFVPSEWSEEDASKGIARDNEIWSDGAGDAVRLAITVDDEPVGLIGLKLDRRHESCETYYFLGAEARGKGLATAALDGVCRWAFDALGMKRIQLFVDPANESSIALAERCGFQREGLLRSHMNVKGRRQDSLLYARLPSAAAEVAG